MIKITFKIFFIAALVFVGCSKQDSSQNAMERFITDDLGNQFVLDTIPKRIITLAPNLSEIVYDLNLQKYLIGNTLYCNYPPEAQTVEKVGDMLTFNFEKILTLKPDLIFITVEGNTKETYDKFRDLGLKLFVSNPRDFEGIKKTCSDLGKIFKIEEDVNKKISDWDSTIVYVKRESEKTGNQTAMFLIEAKPTMLAGKNTFINQYLEMCGLKNIAEKSPMNYPIFNREEILKSDPDFIIYPTEKGKHIPNLKNLYPEWRGLKAIKNNRVVFVDRDLYMRPGPRFAEAVKDLYTKIHLREKADHQIQR